MLAQCQPSVVEKTGVLTAITPLAWKKDQMAEEWESEAWKSLRRTLINLKMIVDIMLDAYTQAVSVQESITANKQVRQVGYLTSLTTLFVPMSFIAAVISMGGDYAPGQNNFHVLWAISLPIRAMAFCVFFLGGSVINLARKYPCSSREEGLPV